MPTVNRFLVELKLAILNHPWTGSDVLELDERRAITRAPTVEQAWVAAGDPSESFRAEILETALMAVRRGEDPEEKLFP